MALFNKNKEEKKHKGENIVGKIIYIFLLFAPLFSILTTSLYTIFNKNAFESYYGETINEKEYTNVSINNLQISETYNFKNSSITLTGIGDTSGTRFDVINASMDNVDLSYADNFVIYVSNNNPILLFRNNTTLVTSYNLNTNLIEFNFELESITSLNYNDWLNNEQLFYKINYNKYSYLDNNFDYGIYKTEQNNLFNWAKNTGTYTVMKTTTDGLEINNTFIPMLLTYWLIISVIYFIYDIALMLIWILHRKIHELTESV